MNFDFTQNAANGIRFDFCDGLRVSIPEGADYRVMMRDADSGIIHYDGIVKGGQSIASKIKFRVRWALDIYDGESSCVFSHTCDLRGMEVLVICNGALGDKIAWFSACPEFARQMRCKLSVLTTPDIADLFRKDYPTIRFVTEEEANTTEYYAAYRLGVWQTDDALDYCPRLWHGIPLDRLAAEILGLDKVVPRPHLWQTDVVESAYRPDRKYVCIATKASAQCKFWNNRYGWSEVIEYLDGKGFDVCCIDKYPEYGAGIVMNGFPEGAIDWTGDVSLKQRAAQLKGAAFFIGLPSGLSWLAWAVGIPVVMISGFSEPQSEFFTPYRVQNTRVCHGCWNDTRNKFDYNDFFWCPRKQSIAEKYECTRAITSRMVIEAIDRLLEEENV